MAEMITILIVAVALVVITGTSTFFATKNIYDDKHEKIKAQINNQLIINEERDKSHEYAQTIFMIILAVVTSCLVLYIAVKCTINVIAMKLSLKRPNLAVQQAQPQAQVQFEA